MPTKNFAVAVEEKKYIVKEGDTIAQISEENKLNPQEFLIANPKYKSEESLLTIGDEVSIALINPVISLAYEVYEVEDVVQYFEKKTNSNLLSKKLFVKQKEKPLFVIVFSLFLR